MASEASTGTLVCRYCECVNHESRQFCTSCGKRLHELCVRCGTLCTSGEKFCGSCGADLEAAARDEAETLKANLEQAPRLASEARYDEALKLLAAAAGSEHPDLAEYAGRAGELIAEIKARRDQHQEKTEEACKQARKHAQASDHEAALKLLEAIPCPLLGEDDLILLEEMRARKQEVVSLSVELEAASKVQKLSPTLLPKIERLLALDPEHALANQLAARLRESLARAAKQRLTAWSYDDAHRLLRQIPQAARTPDTETLLARAAELASLSWDLQNAPVVDRALPGVAKRLRELSPDDPQAAKLEAELQRRAKKPPEAPEIAFSPWASPPRRAYVGYPVEWITGFKRIALANRVDPTPFVEHPGCFCVACGLALQGLGQAAVNLNLIPKDSLNVLDRVSQVMNKRMGKRACWGLDFGSSGLKAVKMAAAGSGGGVKIEDCEFIEHRKVLSQAINGEEEAAIVTEALSAFLSQHSLKGDRLCVGLPGSMAFCRHVALPPVKNQKLDSVMQHEVRHHVPFEPKDLVWDYEVMNRARSEESAGEPLKVVLVAVKRPPLVTLMEQLRAAGLRVDIFQSDCLALHNFVAYERFAADEEGEPADPNTTVAILDVGGDSTNVVVSSPGSVWFRGNRLGGTSFTKVLVREFNLTLAQAERQKRTFAQEPPTNELETAFKPVFEDFAKELEISFASMAKIAGQQKVQEILGVGGGFQLHGLFRYLRLGR